MLKRLSLLLLLTACSQAPAPQPKPQAEQPVVHPSVTRYSIVGEIKTTNNCSAPTPSEVEIAITLANGEHTLTTPFKRIGMMGRSYTFNLDWKNDWGLPTEWRAFQIRRFDHTPFCPNGDAGVGEFNAPVTEPNIRHDVSLVCNCTK